MIWRLIENYIRVMTMGDNNPERVLITGGNGNLGRLVADRLLADGQRVVKFDIPGTEPINLHENETVICGDIRDTDLLKSILTEHRPNTIYHLASLLSGSSEADLTIAWEINATASFKLLNLSVEMGVDKFFFASTAASYAEVDTNPMPQDYPQWPESMYGATKVAVERLGVYFKAKHGLDFRCLRFPLVVSPFAPEGAVSAFPSHAFKAAIRGNPFRFPVARNIGISTLFLDDVIDSIVNYTATDASNLSRHAYNLHAYYLTAEMVADAVRKRFPDFEYSYEPVEVVESLISSWPDVVDDDDARRDWGWQPDFDLEKSADKICELLLNIENETA
jgi:threonine 3-dehydrogenase